MIYIILLLKNIEKIIICVDSESISSEMREKKLQKYIDEECVKVNVEICFSIPMHCIETWLIGNSRINITKAKDSILINYREFYNVNK